MAVKVTTGDGILKARVHCVDAKTKELIYAWLFEIEVDKLLV